MRIEDLKEQFERELGRLHKEIDQYEDESLLWVKKGDINNTAGNLAWHICGNLQHYMGAVLGGTEYQRDRDYEFTASNISREEIISSIMETHKAVDRVLNSLQPSDLEKDYPEQLWGRTIKTGWFLIHLLGHLNYHLGQINYHRRLIQTV